MGRGGWRLDGPARCASRGGGDALAVRGGVSRGVPEGRQLVVEVDEGQRAAGHVQAGDQLTDLGIDDRVAGVAQQPGHGSPHHEQLLVLGRAEPVEDHPDAVAVVGGCLGEDAADELSGQVGRAGQLGLGDAGLAVDA